MSASSPTATPSSALTPSAIATLISTNLYDTRIVPTLEDYVMSQVRSGSYDFPPNRHLLSLYLSTPDLIKHDILKHLLLLSLTSYPSSHFLSLSYLIPLPSNSTTPTNSSSASTPTSAKVTSSATGRTRRGEGEGKGEGWVHYDERVRRMIGQLVERMYSRVSVYVMMDLWHVDKAHVEERVKAIAGWRLEEDGKWIAVGGGKDSTSALPEKRRQNTEVLSEDQLAKLLALVQV